MTYEEFRTIFRTGLVAGPVVILAVYWILVAVLALAQR
jgi:hypothetical protein